MTSQKANEPPSPSASSIFLPLGRRGSRSSLSTQAERETLTEALDQIHSAAYQSHSLTVFNEFANPSTSSSVVENNNVQNDSQGGLSGLYSRLRASVGGAKESGTSGRRVDGGSTPVVRQAGGEGSVVAVNDFQTSNPGSAHASKIHTPSIGALSPATESFNAAPSLKNSKLVSKPSSISSSKTSVSSTPAARSPVPPLTKATDPTVTELNVSAAHDSSRNLESSSANQSLKKEQGAIQQSDPLRSAEAENVDGISSRRSYSPVMSSKLPNSNRDISNPKDPYLKSISGNSVPANDKSARMFDRRDLTELDTSVGGSRNLSESNDEVPNTAQEDVLTTSSSSITADGSTAPTSAGGSMSRELDDHPPSHNWHVSITPSSVVSLEDRDVKSPVPSKLSIDRPQDKLVNRVSTSRLPGYVMSRASSSETATTNSAVMGYTAQPYRHQATNRGTSTPSSTFNQLRSKLLSKEFWMRDENAKDCFLCGEPFTTFRRKHHCRTCGQIFDSKCTSLIPGVYFGQGSSVRVCKPCEDMINSREYDSSDLSDIEQSPITTVNPGHLEFPFVGSPVRDDEDDSSSIRSQSIEHVLKTPTMAIPATRRVNESGNRRSAVLEIGSERPLTRPTSSRSLRSSASLRSHPMGHKRHHSRQQHIRGFKSYHEDRAPFQQRRHLEDANNADRLPAFHRDNIIDPDLAQYLSDDASSGDEQPNLLSVTSDTNLAKSSGEHERATFGGLLAAVKKGRSRFSDRSTANGSVPIRDGDDASMTSSKAVNLPRNSRRRNLSIASSVHQRPSPRLSKDNPLLFHDHHAPSASQLVGPSSTSGFKMTRSSSMRGSSAPAIELNRLSLEHVRKLLRQLLEDSSIPHVNSWETALLPILLKATDDVDPDVQRGDDMDIRHYVKLKKIPGGRPGDTSYVSGLVFTKNLALKSMPRSIPQPSILIITFAIEYARHQQHFMSLEPVIRQEREFLESLVSRIAALQPNLLLVEKSVSGLALELLEKSNIATAYNVKPSVLEAVSRCTQTRIITSMDKLVTLPSPTGHCGSFDLKTYVYGGRRKTYMYISGCAKELGCTIVLRGANSDVLSRVKRITEFMVYVVYNLKLETCLMRDEFAKLPTVEDFSNGVSSAGVKPATSRGLLITETTTVQEDASSLDAREGSIATAAVEVPDDVPMPTYYDDLVEKHETKLLSASPCVKFEPPYLLMRARELERRVSYLARLRDRIVQSSDEKNKSQKFVLITPELVHQNPDNASAKVREVLRAVHDAELDRATHNYLTQKRQWEAYLSGNSNLFDPYAHQNIVVLYSLVCTTTSIPCSGPDIFALDFYNEHESDDQVFEPDFTLGQYVEDLCLEANSVCTANGCENRMYEHHRQYVHGEAQISIFVQPYPSKLRGLQETILMWSCCKICGNETQVIPMSANTWRYSFAKYLELSFWSRNLRARAGVCQHDIHRDYLRFFGFKDMALRIHYDPITLLDIIVPRTRVTWKVDNDLRLRNEVYNKFEHRISKFMLSVKSRLKSIHVESVMPEKVEDCRKEIEILVKKANDDHNGLIRHLQEQYMNSRYWEVIPLNGVLRAVQEKVVEWDTTFADFERNFFPSEKDIRRLASLQLKKIFLDKDASATSLTSTEEAPTTPTEKDSTAVEGEVDGEAERPRSVRRMTLSPEKAQDVLVSVVEEHSGKPDAQDEVAETAEPIPDICPATAPIVPEPNVADQEVEHLDLAVPTNFSSEELPLERQISIDLPQISRVATSPPDAGRMTPSPELSSRPGSGLRKRSLNEFGTSPKQIVPSSGIPRLADQNLRQRGKGKSPPMIRAYSQPLQTLRDKGANGSRSLLKLNSGSSTKNATPLPSPSQERPKFGDKKFTERILNKTKTANGHSMIPRSITPKSKSPRVSSLARHFEQLSREFEKERQRERLQRAAKSKHSRAYPIISSKATVEVYKNVREAVEEQEPSREGEDLMSNAGRSSSEGKADRINEETRESEAAADKEHVTENPALTPPENEPHPVAEIASEAEDVQSDEEQSLTLTGSPEESIKLEDDLDLKELPKHERNTLVKMLANFWAERSASGWQALDYPLKVSDHVFADCDIIVREDEPSSLIAFALDSSDYKNKLATIQDHYDKEDRSHDDVAGVEARDQNRVESALLRPTGTHLKYQFQEGQAKMLCKVFYAEQFDALRRKCGVADRIVESLSRCAKWDSKGGKTKSLFLKTLDDRFVLKSLSQIETQAFLKFAPAYFQIMSEALFHELPSAIAKMFGFYQVIIKNPVTGVEFNWFLLLMENLFYDRVPTRIFDLKGSMRNRKVQSTGERDEVLLDENMVDFIYETPLFTREHSKKLLSQSVWNDTLFLGRQNVMDYSLMIAIDEPRKELVVGIIDCIRTYTWDKKLESWIKDRGFAGGGKNRPTVTSPKEYKSRFRQAMARYVLQAPNCWHEFHSTFSDNRRIENHLSHMQTPIEIETSELTVATNSE
ncbi:1-phosphatidylinositol-3-phosphate 5-kinase (Fab1), putative [Talaromyces stipitatus ATCC 10500]|uniref:1-phosphatidylinositol-3-phosphate 5-kinase n=1 Tax=Talaromyces stipitatus (strain ATCC 10500 / CBS 375.48 / QM 6759 / NRRL 1006) TaxID=441959 RepID=B8MGW0_TALSN|nr:1-phosphatidylinositol-3-phosphate 5-kinase (Fab1), putative [Talaromyces stipitatus ATCC 10500]EED16341.1 1-phosphatidylinositol-3-phosphate 5-kinase (Fab1), putative [Talaromyces stipitatus ATCC 10500]